jgi:hypothetical protein
VESLNATSFCSSELTSSLESIPAKSFTSLGGTGFSGKSWEKAVIKVRINNKATGNNRQNSLFNIIAIS